jgi:hypothetical protein
MNNKNVKQALFGGTNGRRRAKERVKGRWIKNYETCWNCFEKGGEGKGAG